MKKWVLPLGRALALAAKRQSRQSMYTTVVSWWWNKIVPTYDTTGKSTLLRALAVGVYDKVPGDGRELAVADPGAVTIRAEDGRPVSAVDISPFISSLPSAVAAPLVRAAPAGSVASGAASENTAAAGGGGGGAVGGAEGGTAETNGGKGSGSGGGGEGITTERFSTGAASGSTSQAANVVEALEAGATALLLDEDTCAGNVSGGG